MIHEIWIWLDFRFICSRFWMKGVRIGDSRKREAYIILWGHHGEHIIVYVHRPWDPVLSSPLTNRELCVECCFVAEHRRLFPWLTICSYLGTEKKMVSAAEWNEKSYLYRTCSWSVAKNIHHWKWCALGHRLRAQTLYLHGMWSKGVLKRSRGNDRKATVVVWNGR